MMHTDLPTLVLIHGAGATHGIWEPVLSGLSEFTVFTPDLPGHVAGSGASHDTVAGYADAIADSLPEGPVILVGHSLGGLISCELTARDLGIDGIITLGTGAAMTVNEELLTTARNTPVYAMAPIRKWSLHRDAAEDQRAQLENSTSHEAVEAVFDDLTACTTYFDAPARLATFGGPALIVIGDQDRMVPREQAEKLAAASPTARLVIIENSGHTPQITQPDTVVSLITNFVTAE